MEKTRAIILGVLLALAVSAMPLYGRGCILPSRAVTPTCVDSCCMTKGCCAKPAKNTLPASQPPAATSAGQVFLSLTPDLQPLLETVRCSAAERIDCLASAGGSQCVTRAFLCTFLI